MPVLINTTWTIIAAIVVLYLGRFLTSKIRLLKNFNIPEAVSGGLLCSTLVAIYYSLTEQQIQFDLSLRDILLLVFFSTIGLSAKMKTLGSGGRALVILVLCAIVFLVLQNTAGLLVAWVFGADPAYGLLAGSIARYLINRHQLSGDPDKQEVIPGPEETDESGPVTLNGMLDSIFILAICVGAGALMNDWLAQRSDHPLPGFLTAMFTGIVITNLFDVFHFKLDKASLSLCSDVSLQLFLAMSLMSLQLWSLAGAWGPLLVVLLAQSSVTVVFAIYLIFPLLGRDYDAAVISAGFSGLGLGATPVGIANMHSVTEKFGASQKAFLVVPLVGAFFLDLANATIIQLFLATPLFQSGG